jgi:hypothetical protein
LLLIFGFPGNRAAGSGDDGAAHTAKFEERKLNPFTNSITNLGAPASIAIHCKVMVPVGLRGEGVIVGFGVGRMREGHVGVWRSLLSRRKHKAVING